MQNHYSLLYREEEREMFPTLKVSPVAHSHSRGYLNRILSQMFGVGSMPWSPLGRGLLTRTSRQATVRGNTDKFSTTFDMPFLGELTSRYGRVHVHVDTCALLRQERTFLMADL